MNRFHTNRRIDGNFGIFQEFYEFFGKPVWLRLDKFVRVGQIESQQSWDYHA